MYIQEGSNGGQKSRKTNNQPSKTVLFWRWNRSTELKIIKIKLKEIVYFLGGLHLTETPSIYLYIYISNTHPHTQKIKSEVSLPLQNISQLVSPLCGQ